MKILLLHLVKIYKQSPFKKNKKLIKRIKKFKSWIFKNVNTFNLNFLNRKNGNQGRLILRILYRNLNLVKYWISWETLGLNPIIIKVIVQIKTPISIVQEICTAGNMILKILFLDNKKAFRKNNKKWIRKITHLKRIPPQREIIRKKIFHLHAAKMQNWELINWWEST